MQQVGNGAGIDWLSDPDSAFARARARGRPLLLYWGVDWSPPCSRLCATVFQRADFAALADRMVALRIDGDAAGAQHSAERFGVRNYPTVIVYRADGSEITRLPVQLAPERFVALLAVALAAPVNVAQSLSAALSRERALADDEWRLLSFYAWDADERQVLKGLDFAAALASMKSGCTLPEAALRLEWHAVAMSGKGGINKRAAVAWLERILADPQAVAAQMDIAIAYAVDLVRYLSAPQSAARTGLANAWAAALARLELDPDVGVADQLAALGARVCLWRLGATLPHMDALARERVAAALDGAAASLAAASLAASSAAVNSTAANSTGANSPAGVDTNYSLLRHQLVATGAAALADAGLLDEAEQLLRAALAGSHAPFYFMHRLAAIAKKRGDPVAALRWYEQAWGQARGAATRLQWGAAYLQGLVDFAPAEAPRIDRVAGELLAELGVMHDAHCQRNRAQLQRIDSKLSLWRGGGEQAAALRRVARGTPLLGGTPL